MAGNIGIYNPNQRKMLGKRFGVDPALLLAQQELEAKYALKSKGDDREFTAEQNRLSRESTSDIAKGSAFASGVGGLTQSATTLGGIYGLSNISQGKPFFGNLFGTPKTGMRFGASSVATPAAGTVAFGGSITGSPGAIGVYNSTFSEAIGAGYSTAEASALASEAGAAAGAAGVEGAGAATGMGMTTLSYGAPAIAGYAGGQVANKLLGEHVSGPKERGAVGGAVAGAIAGSIVPGVGTVVGAVIGGVVGLVTSGKKTWICTATNKHVGLSKEQRASMKKLRRYAKTHYPGWLEFYNQNGPVLIENIELNEHDLELFYGIVKRVLVQPCVKLIDKGDLELAFSLYKDKTTELFKEYAPDIEIKEVS